MIKFEHEKVTGWEEAVRGTRNSFNSWDKSDSSYSTTEGTPGAVALGYEDLKLMAKLAKAGPSHSKFRRMLVVYVDVTAPLYWWKEYDTYKVGTVANSCSTMHTLHEKEFEMADFSYEEMPKATEVLVPVTTYLGDQALFSPRGFLMLIIKMLNECRATYLRTNDKRYWWSMIQLLPESYNQKRTLLLNYEVLAKIYKERKSHKLDEWNKFRSWIESLPYSRELICSEL